MENVKNIQYKELEAFLAELFEKAGMYTEDAKWHAKSLISANLRGIDSHGVLRAPNYVDRIKCNAINPKPNITKTQLAPAVTLVDGDDAAGCVAAKAAMEQAIENAKQFGVGVAGVMNSNHFGTAAQYAQMAVDAGMIGIAVTNVPTLISAPGAKAKVVGNNPIAIGIPTYEDYPFMLDMSLSVVAEGKLRFAAAKRTKIPFGWAADPDGNPTDDPETALKGFLLPVGGFKGLGLAYAMDILSGLLTGGVFADKIKSMYRNPTEPGKTGHMMIVINAGAFIDKDAMHKRMQEYHEYLESVPVAEGAMKLCFPGEIEHNCEKKRREEGIPVPLTTLEKLEELKGEFGIEAVI